jgi:hypothetical protein
MATSQETGDAVAGLRVLAMDADVLFDDLLGQAVTDEEGRYEIDYDVRDFRDLIERAPDIYLIVIAGDRVVGDTRHALVRDAEPDREINFQIPAASESGGTPSSSSVGQGPVFREPSSS